MQRNATRCYMAIYFHTNRRRHYKAMQGVRKTAVQSSSCKIKIQDVLLYAILPHTPHLFLLKTEIFFCKKNPPHLEYKAIQTIFFQGVKVACLHNITLTPANLPAVDRYKQGHLGRKAYLRSFEMCLAKGIFLREGVEKQMENIFFEREKKAKNLSFLKRDAWLVCTLHSCRSDLANNY